MLSLLFLLTPALAFAGTPAEIQTTLTAMEDGVGVGQEIVGFLEKRGIAVEFAAQESPSAFARGRILLSDALPRLPRVLAPYIAKEAAELMLAGHADDAEREYLKISVVARAWRDLGGEIGTLPRLDLSSDYQDARLASRLRAWQGTDVSSWAQRSSGKFQDYLVDELLWRRLHP